MSTMDEKLLKSLEDFTKNVARHQAETLQSILHRQRGVHYLKGHLSSYDEPIDAATYRRAVPLSRYDDLAVHINKLADGADHDQPLLSVDPLVCFFYSSGTSSMKPKLIPYFDSELSKASSYLAHQGSFAILRRLVPPRPRVNKIMWFIYADTITTTRGGYKVMAASTFPLQSTSNRNQNLFLTCTSPREVILGSNIEQQMYCHLLCGLRNFDSVDGIRAPYAIGLIRAFSLLESKWEQLCDDIGKGFPSLEINDVSMKDSVIEVLGGPQPDLSQRIWSICKEKNWCGIVPKLWPNVRYVKCVTTGTMKQYYSRLKSYAGEVPLLGGDYFASECCVGINMDIVQPPDDTRFTMLPTAAYFEFLPFDPKESKVVGVQTLDLCSVEVGEMYEVVVTTYRGLYRYRLGDIVRVVGFHNSSPQVEFVTRAPKTSSEVVTERDLMTAMDNFQLDLRKLGIAIDILEFASFFNLDSSPKRLKIFFEVENSRMFLQGDKSQPQGAIAAIKECLSTLEDNLGSVYKVQRDRGELSCLSVSIVKHATFDKLLEIALKNGAPASQYKPPKIIRNCDAIEFMEGSVLMSITMESA